MDHRKRIRYINQPILPLETIRIGRWVPNVRLPHHGYLDPSTEAPPRLHTFHHLHFRQMYERDAGTSFTLEGTLLAYGSFLRRDLASESISSDVSTVYQMDDPDSYFRSAIKHPMNRQWIERALKTHGKIYMIIGYQTVLDAAIQMNDMLDTETTTRLQAPVGAALTAATAIPVLTEVLDSSADMALHKRQKSGQSFVAKGEQIVAIQYRRIHFKFFSSRKVGEDTLENECRWKYLWDMRGRDPVVNDLVEASLAYNDMTDDERLEESDEAKDDDDGDGGEDASLASASARLY